MAPEFQLDSQVGWSNGNCLAMARAASLAYADGATINATCRGWGFDHVANIFSEGTDTQAFIAKREDVSVLAFRGTEPLKLMDWMTDLQLEKRWLPTVGNVHKGFRKAWYTVKSSVLHEVPQDRPVFICGHSLGGALATLAMADFAILQAERYLFSFGAPRVFDKDAAEEFSRRHKGFSFRLVNNSDGVTHVPTRMHGYDHVAQAIVADADGIWQHDGFFWDRLLERVKGDWREWIDGRDVAPIKDHLMASYVAVAEKNAQIGA